MPSINIRNKFIAAGSHPTAGTISFAGPDAEGWNPVNETLTYNENNATSSDTVGIYTFTLDIPANGDCPAQQAIYTAELCECEVTITNAVVSDSNCDANNEVEVTVDYTEKCTEAIKKLYAVNSPYTTKDVDTSSSPTVFKVKGSGEDAIIQIEGKPTTKECYSNSVNLPLPLCCNCAYGIFFTSNNASSGGNPNGSVSFYANEAMGSNCNNLDIEWVFGYFSPSSNSGYLYPANKTPQSPNAATFNLSGAGTLGNPWVLSGLAAGSYIVQFTDADNCGTSQKSFTIN